jgi:uncharacterized protein YecE (DUF72 family)
MEILAGTSGYSDTSWKGSFYPAKLKNSEMLQHYAGQLPTVEINNTFYRVPKTTVVQGWADAAPEGFRFALKASRRITHFKRLRDPDQPLSYLFRQADVLGAKLGPVLFQLPPDLPLDLGLLREFLQRLPRQRRVVFEFRHRSWFDDGVYEALQQRDAALCVSDQLVDVPRIATASWGYLRLREDGYEALALDQLAAWIEGQGWSEAYLFFKKDPELARRFMLRETPRQAASGG